MSDRIINIFVAGLGGQGVITATDIIAETAFRMGCDVKKSEVHGMSQRNGSVTSEIRVGPAILSPLIPRGEADYLVCMAEDQTNLHRYMLREGGIVISPANLNGLRLPSPKTLNSALLGVLSNHLDWPEGLWIEAAKARLPEKNIELNLQAFALGRKGTGNA
jgi:indolepyruvate ferredoxin oxidoreductase beta subunit